MPIHTCLQLCLLLLVAASATHDVVTRRIPNVLLLLAWLVALPLQVAAGTVADCLLGALTGFAVFLPLYLLRGMAAGDVKLMATVGAFAGPAVAFEIAIVTWCVGGAMAVALLLAHGRLAAAWANIRELLRPLLWRLAGAPAVPAPLPAPSVGGMPYGLAIALATLGVLLPHHV